MKSLRPLQEQSSSEQNSPPERKSAVADEKRPSTFAYFIPRIAGSLLGGYLLWRASREFFLLAPDIGSWWGRLSTKWAFAFLCFIGIHLLFFVAWLAALWLPQTMRAKLHAFASPLLRLRGIKKFRWPLAFAIVLLPTWFLLYTQLGGIFSGPYLRLLVLLDCSTLVAALVTADENRPENKKRPADQEHLADRERLVTPTNLAFAIIFTGTLFYIASLLTNVTNYPFALSWSEGNRLYDFSVQIDPQRYQYPGDIPAPYYVPGRYFLWGIPFLIPNTPIWLHRLWDAMLWIIPYLLFGYQLARRSRLDHEGQSAASGRKIPIGELTFWLWIYLFLAQGPIYPPLLLSAILVVATCAGGQVASTQDATSSGKQISLAKWGLAIAGAALAGYYASASRWTWLPASAAWSVIILLSEFQFEKDVPWWRHILRLFPIALVGGAAIVGGAIANPKLLSPQKVASGTALSQPLLWYRLFPNVTYPDGILRGLAIATLPVIILLIWLAITRRWPMNWLQALAYATASLAFLAIGIVASVKIGGGNNLHNLDMFFVTLALLAGLALRQHREHANKKGVSEKYPGWVSAILGLALVLPAWAAMKDAGPLQLPAQAEIDKALAQIAAQAKKAQRKADQGYPGEVLFIDQRQLLAFGYIDNVTLIPEYEKKYLMDKAMAGDAAYFEGFYLDLANQRFQLIVSDPLVIRAKGPRFSFNEENNAWVFWVSRPLLCYYTPIATFEQVKVQLLVPRDDPENCVGVSP